jgi:hypothetical protein
VLNLLGGAIDLALIAESQPERRPEGGWFDFLGFLARERGLRIQQKKLVRTIDT